MEWIQRESGKDWFWFSQCFVKGRVFKDYYWGIWIGPTPGEKVNGWGILAYSESILFGNFVEGSLEGFGTLIYNSGVK